MTIHQNYLWAALAGYVILCGLIIFSSLGRKRYLAKLCTDIRARPITIYVPESKPANLHPRAGEGVDDALQESWRYPPLPNPVGYVTRKHKDGVLVKDGGHIVSESFLVDGNVPSTGLYSQTQMWDYAEASVKQALEQMLAELKADLHPKQAKEEKK